jgi:hypothetical protein
MLKSVRFSLLLLALCVSFLAAPEAFGAKKGGQLIPNRTTPQGYWIDCSDGSDLIPCAGSYEYCVGYCDGVCGGGPGSCA